MSSRTDTASTAENDLPINALGQGALLWKRCALSDLAPSRFSTEVHQRQQTTSRVVRSRSHRQASPTVRRSIGEGNPAWQDYLFFLRRALTTAMMPWPVMMKQVMPRAAALTPLRIRMKIGVAGSIATPKARRAKQAKKKSMMI
jgi:hypothetical protein